MFAKAQALGGALQMTPALIIFITRVAFRAVLTLTAADGGLPNSPHFPLGCRRNGLIHSDTTSCLSGLTSHRSSKLLPFPHLSLIFLYCGSRLQMCPAPIEHRVCVVASGSLYYFAAILEKKGKRAETSLLCHLKTWLSFQIHQSARHIIGGL